MKSSFYTIFNITFLQRLFFFDILNNSLLFLILSNLIKEFLNLINIFFVIINNNNNNYNN